ncbi:uncharacterized protein LOC133285151 [Gastrolobium bilobum]|uniref:uncharacterized protein LOC133285151 n=1 Tax=Gastrolobium bilobum TaxID=150636 RepID=UPI002AAF32E2|nr:uncharacterized protein LOC133285151 [Gastrolobium bilobum]
MPSFISVKGRGSYLKGCNIRRGLQVIKCQNYQDEGRSIDMVDENLKVLKERIEMVKVKERLERCCKCQQGWNYGPVSDHKTKRNKDLSSLIELTGLVCGTLGFTCFGGTLLLCLVSMLVHLQL